MVSSNDLEISIPSTYQGGEIEFYSKGKKRPPRLASKKLQARFQEQLKVISDFPGLPPYQSMTWYTGQTA